ncbi:MAG: SDR family oxidoreductase [Bacteroidota bacterium]
MKILLTGATGYIGKRLLPVLMENGHEVVCCVRDKTRMMVDPDWGDRVSVIEVDFLQKKTLKTIPKDIDGAYYLIHSMTSTDKGFDLAEAISAHNFKDYLNNTLVKHVVYLSGIANDPHLSRHLASRKNVEDILISGNYKSTTLRAGIIIGSGSSSFEIIRNLVEKLPVMIAPHWLLTRSQPIAIRDVIYCLEKVLFKEECFNRNYDIGGPDVMTYKDMLLELARIRGLKRRIYALPVLFPRLSSVWLFLFTPASFPLASHLVSSMGVEVVARNDRLHRLLGVCPLTFYEAVEEAFVNIRQNSIISSWTDAMTRGRIGPNLSKYIEIPNHGCFEDIRSVKVSNIELVTSRIWSIGGEKGWYYANWLWQLRGMTDRLIGGVGLIRGRRSPDRIHAGDTLDCWRVLVADKQSHRLLLFAEMKLPGEAWLEFSFKNNILIQTATFRPKGLSGRIYWYLLMPIHLSVFRGMIKKLAKDEERGTKEERR